MSQVAPSHSHGTFSRTPNKPRIDPATAESRSPNCKSMLGFFLQNSLFRHSGGILLQHDLAGFSVQRAKSLDTYDHVVITREEFDEVMAD